MTTIPHDRPRRRTYLDATEMWASLAIAVIWLAVLFAAVYGPDIVTRSSSGDGATIPSAVGVAFFAFLATWQVAKHGFKRDDTKSG
jgi:peptidoglycan/LPS O-acetylase OafA/YrhL